MKQEVFDRKFMNAWQMIREKSNHPVFSETNQGQIVFIYNDPGSNAGRNMSFMNYDWYFFLTKNQEYTSPKH